MPDIHTLILWIAVALTLWALCALVFLARLLRSLEREDDEPDPDW